MAQYANVPYFAELRYIMGNPPFVGYSLQNKEQKDDILTVFVDQKGKPYKTAGKIDYVAGWYYKAAQMMKGTEIRTALVSTNSITQGEQVAAIWKPLMEQFGVHIDFAWRTFRWDSEASIKAHVHCVIVGFSNMNSTDREPVLFTTNGSEKVKNICPYLINSPTIIIDSRTRAICDVPPMVNGSKPVDGGRLMLNEVEREDILKKEPKLSKFIRRIFGSDEYINEKIRYCLWLVDASPSEIRESAILSIRVKEVREFRLASPKADTIKSAQKPALFQQIRQPSHYFIIVRARHLNCVRA